MLVQELGQKYIIIVGDAKTYNILQDIRHEYKSQLRWLIPFPGDWHVLYNFQKALLKPYTDAGLASLGKVAGHRAETLTSLLQASNFRRTHEFLLQAYEAFYRFFLSLYVANISDRLHHEAESRLEDSLTAMVADLATNISNPPLSNPPLSDRLHHEARGQPYCNGSRSSFKHFQPSPFKPSTFILPPP